MDIELNYKQKGQGEVLFLLHGNSGSLHEFDQQVDFFSGCFRVIALDTRGHGESPRGTEPFTISRFAEDLLCFMEEHRIEKANILGFSDGGNIALTFALRYPEHVKKLILNGANLYPRGVKAKTQIPIELGYLKASLFACFSEKAKHNADMLALMVREPHIRPIQLHSLFVPTLVIAGTNDMIREKHTRLIYKSLPNAKLVFIEGDHFIAQKNPMAYNEAIYAFLKTA